MKCTNCKKDILDNNAYCTHCGEEISNISNSTSNEFNSPQSFEKTNVDLGNEVNKLKEYIQNNKITSMVVGGLICVFILIVSLTNYLNGIGLSEKKLKEKIVGKSIEYQYENYKITDKNISSLEVVSRTTKKKKSDLVDCKITFDFETAKVTSDINLSLTYDTKEKEWVLSKMSSPENTVIEPKSDLDSNLESILKTGRLKSGYSSIYLEELNIKSISDVTITDKENNIKNVTATLLISNSLVESKYSVNFDTSFDLTEGKWELTSSYGYIESEIIEKEKLIADLTEEDKKNFVLNSFSDSKSYTYKYDNNRSQYIYLNKNDISELKVTNFMEYKDNTIRAEVEGQAKNGPLSNITFSGVVYINSSLSSSSGSSNRSELTINSVKLDNISLPDFKNALLDFKIDNAPITVAMSETLAIESEKDSSTMFDKYYICTIDNNGTSQKLDINVELNYNSETKTYYWKIYRIYTIKE